MSGPFEEPVFEMPIRLEPGRVKLNAARRWLLVALAAGFSSVLGLARWLDPDARGYGTHEQLGLPPCAFRALVGVPCPSCGMTTSFAYVVRGQLWEGAGANVAGCLLALGAAAAVPWCLASAAVGRTMGLRSPERAVVRAVVAIVAISVVGWAVRFLFFRGQG